MITEMVETKIRIFREQWGITPNCIILNNDTYVDFVSEVRDDTKSSTLIQLMNGGNNKTIKEIKKYQNCVVVRTQDVNDGILVGRIA